MVRAGVTSERFSANSPDVDINAPAVPSEPGAKVPDLERTQEAIERPRNRSIETTLLTLLGQ